MAAHTTLRAEVTTSLRAGDRLEGPGAAASRHTLRHPGPQFDVRPTQLTAAAQRGSEQHLERVVACLLRELSETRRERAEKDVQLAACKEELGNLLRSAPVAREAGPGGGPARGSGGLIKAFRPPGVAPAPAPIKAPARGSNCKPAMADSRRIPSQAVVDAALQQADALASMHLENAELRNQVRELKARVSVAAAAVAAQQPMQRPASPGLTTATVVVSSPRHTGEQCDLTVAVFEPPGKDIYELQQQLNKLQRENLKMSSKYKAAEAELANRSITAKRWEEACEAQAAQIAALKVDLEQERRCRAQLEQVVARAGDECDARDEDVSALLAQLRSAESAASAGQGEAAGLRMRLGQVEGLLATKQQEVQQLKEHLNSTVARLQASELVRHDAESEKHILAAANKRLQQNLEDAQQRAGGESLELRSAVATLQSKLDAEEQHSAMLQAQIHLLEQQGREKEHMLTEQLRTVQDERNACLAAATRADALLIKLGSHAWQLKAGSVAEHPGET